LRAVARLLPLSRGTKALAFARWANDSTIGLCATSLAFVPSVAGTFCSASKYSRQLSGTDAGLSR
jgi:hypothetical protein